MELAKNLRSLLLLAVGSLCVEAGDFKTLSLRVPEGHNDVTYNADLVSLKDLKHWLTLSPILSQNNGFLIPENVVSCDIQDPAYTNCGPHWSLWLSASNAAHTQERIQSRLDRLNSEEFPADFRPVVDYFKAVQSFALWRNQKEIEFFKGRDISLLEDEYPALHLDLKVACSSELEAIRKSKDEISEWKLVVFQWHNCLWKQFVAAKGDYPQSVWDQALKSRGVQEHLVVVE